MLFFKSRPFAYDGIITFWVPTVAFFAWIPVMTGLVLRAIRRNEEEGGTVAAPAGDEEPAAARGEVRGGGVRLLSRRYEEDGEEERPWPSSVSETTRSTSKPARRIWSGPGSEPRRSA